MKSYSSPLAVLSVCFVHVDVKPEFEVESNVIDEEGDWTVSSR